MQSCLEYENRILIINSKFYKSNVHHTSKLYHIFVYVKNKEVELQGNYIEVSEMLLYAMTNERILSDSDYVMSGNKISVKTPDLNQD